MITSVISLLNFKRLPCYHGNNSFKAHSFSLNHNGVLVSPAPTECRGFVVRLDMVFLGGD